MSDPLKVARAYLDKLPAAISGQGGHDATFRAACWVVRFGLSDGDAMMLMRDYNRRCDPPWTEKELAHKLKGARRVTGGQIRTFPQPKVAVRVTWKIEPKPPKQAPEERIDPLVGLPPAERTENHCLKESMPYRSSDGTLVIPFDCQERYQWWKPGGMRLVDIRREFPFRVN
jgi:hypothetical protein